MDSFCSSASLLPSGKVLISGGRGERTEELTSRESQLLDYEKEQVIRTFDMKLPRWYGTMTRLSDGRVMTTGGGVAYADGTYEGNYVPKNIISSTPEIFTEGKGWQLMPNAKSRYAFGARNNRWWYPRQWVTPTGTVFGVSTEKMWELFPNGGANATIREVGDFKRRPSKRAEIPPNVGPTSTAVMYAPGLILQVGGNGYTNSYQSPSSSLATVFDIRDIGQGNVVVRETAPMENPRQWANAAVLPNGVVAVFGGSRFGDTAGSNDVRAVELWDPVTEQWTTGPDAAVYRGYHSTAALLPSGAILVSGGGVPGPEVNFNAQVYLPPYMFQKDDGLRSIKAWRPRILRMSTNSLDYHDILFLEASTKDIQIVSLIALPAVTHSFDPNQRRMELNFDLTDGKVEVTMPMSPNYAPPGYYYLSIVDSDGFPSPAVIIAISAVAPPLPRQLPHKPATPSCEPGEETKGSLNSCVEQEKCFSLSYEKVDDSGGECLGSTCGYKWKVCIEANRDNPCCTKKLRKRPKRAFKRACIRGRKDDSCLTDDVSLSGIKPKKNFKFEGEICETVRPGENATFQLVSVGARRDHTLFFLG